MRVIRSAAGKTREFWCKNVVRAGPPDSAIDDWALSHLWADVGGVVHRPSRWPTTLFARQRTLREFPEGIGHPLQVGK